MSSAIISHNEEIGKKHESLCNKVAVLGAGSWGTALASQLKKNGNDVYLWGRNEKVLSQISNENKNEKYFPSISLTPGIKTTTSIKSAVDNADLIVFTVPSNAYRETAVGLHGALKQGSVIVSAAKGIEVESLKSLSTVLFEEESITSEITVLSGPSFALEVIQSLPTAVTIAGRYLNQAAKAAKFFHSETFRVYTSDDLVGVEFGGVLKNIIALAAGLVEGAGFGQNARAALITRGLVEMRKIILALGGRAETVMGLSGMGDLFLTATGDLSRNKRVGYQLGKGQELAKILKDLGQVAEAVNVTDKIYKLAQNLNVEVPIIEQVKCILNGEKNVERVVKDLLSRSPKQE
ncbi:MAG: NAD(P)-dependent glycerol-3-phosphate dehydrogenase [Proteobacteria bacterium]|nr:NAD(P)-dependent glycerol-3-phosphate dehydrogenase [Pseudomonadota bacterium]